MSDDVRNPDPERADGAESPEPETASSQPCAPRSSPCVRWRDTRRSARASSRHAGPRPDEPVDAVVAERAPGAHAEGRARADRHPEAGGRPSRAAAEHLRPRHRPARRRRDRHHHRRPQDACRDQPVRRPAGPRSGARGHAQRGPQRRVRPWLRAGRRSRHRQGAHRPRAGGRDHSTATRSGSAASRRLCSGSTSVSGTPSRSTHGRTRPRGHPEARGRGARPRGGPRRRLRGHRWPTRDRSSRSRRRRAALPAP